MSRCEGECGDLVTSRQKGKNAEGRAVPPAFAWGYG